MKGLIYTYLATYVGGPVAVLWPFLGLLIFINFAIVQPPSMWHWVVPASNYSEIIGGGMLIGWVLRGTGNWQFGRGKPMVIALVGFLVWVVVCALASDHPSAGRRYFESILKIALPFLVGVTLIDTPKRLRIFLWTLAMSQGYVAFEFNLSYYNGFNPMTETAFGGLDNNCLAVAMVVGTGLTFFLGLSERRLWLKGVAYLAAALMVNCIMFSSSRGGMLALILLGVASFLLIEKRPKYVLIFVLGAVLALRLAGAETRQRFAMAFVNAEERDGSATGRLLFWGACWDMMLKNPLFGVGPGQWSRAAEAYGYGGRVAHSLWFETGAESGFPGVGLLLAFYGTCIWRLYPLSRRNSQVAEPWFRDVARMIIASLTGFMLAVQFVSVYTLEIPYYVVLVGTVLLKLNSAAARESPPAIAWTPPPAVPLVAQGER